MEIFAAIPPGLEGVLAEEVSALADRPARAVVGGVCLEGDLTDAAGLALWSRTAAHVRVRLGTVPARSLEELATRVRGLSWRDFVHPGQRLEVKATLKGARFRHPDAAAARVRQAAEAALKGPRLSHRRPPPPQAVQVRVEGGEATISLDAGGGLLHRRGYRQATAKAPLRENLAAALLLAAGWVPGAPLADPMCGAGTFSIEAAGMDRELAPGLDRYSREAPPVTHWPAFPKGAWDAMLADARRSARPRGAAPIATSDRDPGAIRAARDNARRAGVLESLHISQAPLEQAPLAPFGGRRGLVILNPPYGVRVADRSRLHGLYKTLGAALRERYPGWRLATLATDRALAGRLLPGMESLAEFRNGGIAVALYIGEIPGDG